MTAKDGRGYLAVKVDGTQINVHRILWMMRHGPIPEGLYIDHRDGDKEHNQDSNLRLCTPVQNNRNRRMNRNNKSGHKNVSWAIKEGKWMVSMCDGTGNNKHEFIGLFDSLEEAALEAKAARERIHGDFHNHAEA